MQTHIISPALWGCHVERNTENLMNGNMNCGMATTDKTALQPPSPWTTHVKDVPLATQSVQQGRGTQQNSILKSLCQWLHPLPEIDKPWSESCFTLFLETDSVLVCLSRLIWTPLKLVPPGTNFSEIFGPTLKNLFPL